MTFTTPNMLPWLTGATALASLTACTTKQVQQPVRPNIVYIMTDDHTAQMMSCYDRRYVSTPNLDRIAADGVRFTQSFVANSLSGPSRACILTGKHSCANRFFDNTTCVFDTTQLTYPKLLRKAGYQTAAIGKWHLESLPSGFDFWKIVPGQGDYYNPSFILQTGDTVRQEGYLTNLITDEAIDWMEHRRNPDQPFCLLIHHKAQHRNWMADTCHLALYEDQEFPLPDNFFDDYEGRPAAEAAEMRIARDMDLIYDLKMYQENRQSRLRPNYEAFVGRMNKQQRAAWDAFYQPIAEEFYRSNLQGKELAQWKFNRYMRDYAKTLRSLDENVGRVLDYLEEHNLLDNTLVVYTSDQGFYMGEHGWFDKRFMYEESLRTPLIVSYPGHTKPGSVCNRLVQNIDYAPTFLALAGVSQPKDMPGRSLVPVLDNGDNVKNWRQSIYYHYYDYPTYHMVRKHDGVRTDRYKLIHFYGKGGLDAVPENKYQNVPGTREYATLKGLESIGYFEPKDEAVDYCELYDLQADPHEQNNIFGKPGTEKITKQLQRELNKYRKTLAVDEY